MTSVSECYLGDNPEGAAALDNSKVDRQVVRIRKLNSSVPVQIQSSRTPHRMWLTQACNALQDALHRVARDCANVTFLVRHPRASPPALRFSLHVCSVDAIQ